MMKAVLFVACLLSWSLSYYVLSRDRKSRLFVLFSIFSFITGLWIFANLMTGFVSHIFWLRSAYALGAAVPASGLAWLLYLVQKRLNRIHLILIVGSGAFFFAVSLAGGLVVAQASNIYLGGYQGKTGPLFPLWGVYMVVILMLFIWRLHRSYRASSGVVRNQLLYLLVGAIGFIGISLTVSFVLPLFGILRFTSLDSPSALIFTCLTTYAITRYRLMDISIIIKKSLVYSATVGVITSMFVLSVLGLQYAFSEYSGYTETPVAAVAALIIAFAFYPLKNRIQRVVDKYFYKGAYDYHGVLGDASKAMTSILDFEKLLSYILRAINDSMKIERGWILLRSEGGKKFDVRMTAAFGKEHEFPAEAPLTSRNALVEYVRANTEAIVREEVERMLPADESGPISQEMGRFNADVAVPIVLKNRLMGAILLGPKLSGDIYTDEDLQLLTTLANQAAVAIRNAQLYSRLQQDLDTIRYLEREKAKAERLASLGTMAAGIAHEIKNPLVSIKTFAQLLPEKASDPEFRDDFSQIAIKEIDRIDSLVQGLLSLAKPSPPILEPIDVNAIIDEIVTSVLIRMENKKISLKKEYGDDVPPAMGDVHQLKQVFSNIIINGIQATPERGQITITTFGVSPSYDEEGSVTVKISDNGRGISEEESEKIFNPFFTTKHEGVGLGLTICHRIVEDHRGTIQMDSELGKGTTFTITVPAAKRERRVASRTGPSQ